MGLIKYTKDTLVSLVNGMGKVGSDKAASTEYELVSYTDLQLAVMYKSTWLARKIVNVPAFDSFRRWRNWQADEADIGLIEAEEKRLNIQAKAMRALILARLFGGSALYIGTGDRDPSKPLDVEKVGLGGLRSVTILRKSQLSPGDIDTDPESDYYDKPSMYTLTTSNSLGVNIHPSRLVIFSGDTNPDEELMPNISGRGWGDPVLVATMQAIKNADATAANVASLVFEAKVDVVKVPDLMSSLADPEYRNRLLERFQLANVAKGVNGMLLLDNEEEYEQKSASFATLPDVLDRFLQMVAGAADIPLTRLLGQSPAGMNATGEGDLRNYYDRIQAIQNTELSPAMIKLTEVIIRSATGDRNEDIHYIWAPLWQLSDTERATLGKTTADTIKVLNDTGLYPPDALAHTGANMLVEQGVAPGFVDAIEEAGGLPDYEAEAEADRQTQLAQIEATAQAKANAGAQPPAKAIGADGIPVDIADGNMKSLYVRRDVLNGKSIRKHYEDQGVTVTVENLHITVIWSRTALDWFKVGEVWEEGVTINGGARDHAYFGPPGLENSLVLMVSSRSLEWRHTVFKMHGAESDFEEYQPHVTLQYSRIDGTALEQIDLDELTPYSGKIELGPEIFEEAK